MTLAYFPDGVENPENLARITEAARLLGGVVTDVVRGDLIAVENAPGARSVYGGRPATSDVTLAVGNEKRGLSRGVLSSARTVVEIPTESRTVRTLNVAAAAAVAGWYVLRGSGPQAQSTNPENRRPTVLVVGDDHVEVGSTLRSLAAFGWQHVLLVDRGAGWFDGSHGVRREARAAARAFKNPLRVRRAALDDLAAFEEIVVVDRSEGQSVINRERLSRGRRQAVVLGASPDEVEAAAPGRVRVASLGLERVERSPLRLEGSIALAEIARQVGRRSPRGTGPAARRGYRLDLDVDTEVELLVEEADLLWF